MWHSYDDIISRLGDPQWWDEAGVPRYCDFEPEATNNIYINEAVLLLIACQSCCQRFKVALSWGALDKIWHKVPSLSQRVSDNTIHYGDPPNTDHCPAGPTMNSIPLTVLEFWRREDGFEEWQRVPDLERDIDDELSAEYRAEERGIDGGF